MHIYTYTQVGLKLGAGSILSTWKSQSRLRQIAAVLMVGRALYLCSFVCLDDFTASERSSIALGSLNYQKNLNPPMAEAWPRNLSYCFFMLGQCEKNNVVLLLVSKVTLPKYFTLMRRELNEQISTHAAIIIIKTTLAT